MKNDLENTINALEDLELERLYLKKLINEYITLKNTIISQLSNNKVSKEVPILTYTSSKRC